MCCHGRLWAHGVTVSTFLFLSFSDFVAVRRNDSTKQISFFCCLEALVCFHVWRSVAVLKNARILLFKIRFAFNSVLVKSYEGGKASVL